MKEEKVEKDTWIHVRVTKSELDEIKSQMELYGYNCRSKFIRAKLLNKRIRVNRNVVLTDSAIRNKINGLSNLIGRIGADYNQATKRFNSLVKQKRKHLHKAVTEAPTMAAVMRVRLSNRYIDYVSIF